ncbi:unnamed protein product [Linum trigynum]
MIVWVHLPELKIHFYHKEVLNTLGNLIGRTIKLDYHTLTQQRAKFARLAVEVDLSRPLVPRIWLDDDWQPVEYENLPTVCFECGKIGHSSTSCPLLRPTAAVEGAGIADGGTQVSSPESSSEVNAVFGPWMLVTRKGRRNPRDLHSKGKEKDLGINIKSKEKELGNFLHGAPAKNGKNGLKTKESEVSLPVVAQQSPSHLQRPPAQGRIDNGGKSSGEGKQNGKEVLREEGSPAGKSLLGPGPSQGPSSKKGQPKSEAARTSPPPSKLLPDPSLISGPNEGTSSGPRTQDSPKVLPLTPPPTCVSTGPNGTIMQIIQVPSESGGSHHRSEKSSPSTVDRTKGKRSSKGRSKKGSPAKLNPMRPLHVWSPMKDRKAKSKSRMASLTLHEINAWTEAAQSAKSYQTEKALSEVHLPPSSPGYSMGVPPTSSALTGADA